MVMSKKNLLQNCNKNGHDAVDPFPTLVINSVFWFEYV